MLFQRFGSASSVDIDVVVFVDSIDDNPFSGTELCRQFNAQIAQMLSTNKKVNTNLAVLRNGNIVKVLKGTSDETNNALLSTYALHEQVYPNQIQSLLERDVDLKLLRTTRVLLSYLSKTQSRLEVKAALQQDVRHQAKVLEHCCLRELDRNTLGAKDTSEGAFSDFKKSYAFHMGQTIALVGGIELYTKESIAAQYPDLDVFLRRDPSGNIDVLESWKQRYVQLVDQYPLKTLVEYKR